MLYVTKRYWLDTSSRRLEVYDHRLASRLNRFLKKYDDGSYSFKEGEEALFNLSQIEMAAIWRPFLRLKSTPPSPPATTLATQGVRP